LFILPSVIGFLFIGRNFIIIIITMQEERLPELNYFVLVNSHKKRATDFHPPPSFAGIARHYIMDLQCSSTKDSSNNAEMIT